jgi:hypothetical protein
MLANWPLTELHAQIWSMMHRALREQQKNFVRALNCPLTVNGEVVPPLHAAINRAKTSATLRPVKSGMLEKVIAALMMQVTPALSIWLQKQIVLHTVQIKQIALI